MPNKTIYVSDDDLPLYKKAQELAGNLSSAISIALRKYVELEEGRLEGYDEITVRVGRGTGRKQRFSGVLLAEGGRSSKFGYERYLSGWRSWVGNWSSDQSWSMAQGEATLHVVDTLEQLRELIPEDLYELVEEAASHPTVEDLDI